MLFDSSITGLYQAAASIPHVLGYLDPGSGSMLLQIMFAGALSGMFFMKTWFRQLRSTMTLKNPKA
jgi:hypothetical protein